MPLSTPLHFDPTQINPLLIIGFSALAYGVASFVRSQIASLLALGVGLFCLSFLLLPSGHRNLETAHRLPERLERVKCLALALPKGAPLKAGAAKSVDACHFKGQEVKEPDQATLRELIKTNGPVLRQP